MTTENNKNQVLNAADMAKALECSILAYHNIVATRYNTWSAYTAANFGIPVRALVTHKGAYRWYQDQWLHFVETPIIEAFGSYIKEGVTHSAFFLDEIYSHSENIKNTFPKVLLKDIQRIYHKDFESKFFNP